MAHHSRKRTSQLRKLILHHRSITSAEKALAFAQSAGPKEVVEMMGRYVEMYEHVSNTDERMKDAEEVLGEAVSVLSNCVWLNRRTIQLLISYKRRILNIIERAFQRPSVPKILAFRDIIACALRWVGSEELRSDELSFFLRLLRCAAHGGSRACRNLLQLNSANVLADNYAKQDCECRLKTVEVLLLVSTAVPEEHWADQILTTEFLPKLMADVKGDCPACDNCSRFPSLKRAAQRLLFALLQLDGEIKIQLCKHGAIEYVLQCCKKSKARKEEFIRALASFSSEAYSRQMMRRSSALLYLAEIFERSDKLQLDELLLRAFVCFRYDEPGLLVLLSRESFRAKLFNCLALFLNSHVGVNPSNDNSGVSRLLSPWKISWCSSPDSRSERSAEQEANDSGAAEDSHVATDSQVTTFQEVEAETVLARSEKELVDVVKCHDTTDCCLCLRLPDYTGFTSILESNIFNSVSLCLTLLASLASQDSLSHTLCSTNVWHTFLALAVAMHYPYEKLLCILKQILRNRNCLELLIANGVCSLIFKYLINPVHQCDNCFGLTSAGCDLIATLNHEDSNTRYVTKTAVRMFKFGTDQQRLLAACSMPFLSMHLSELNFADGIAFMCDHLVINEDRDVEQLQDVFTSLTILYHRFCRMDCDADYKEKRLECCYPRVIEAKDQVHFYYPDSDLTLVADRSVLCSNSEFYRAMLNGGFVEAGRARFPLVTDDFSLRCNELLLHLLHGCYYCPSVRLKSSEECAELIHLASSRLCFAIVAHLVDEEVDRWLTTSSVITFLQVALLHRITSLAERCLKLLIKIHFLDFALIAHVVRSLAVVGLADEFCFAAKELFSNGLVSRKLNSEASNWFHSW
uniref:BTB domain-containing protein n=1 Tax=Trichuris muris TaxID=70415 RepID=A0A5S6QI04_TRIMR